MDQMTQKAEVEYNCVFYINQSELNIITGESNVPFMTELAVFFFFSS